MTDTPPLELMLKQAMALVERTHLILTPEEARIVLIGLDGYREMGWDGAPYTAALQSAIDKLEAQAGDLDQATVHPLQQKLEP